MSWWLDLSSSGAATTLKPEFFPPAALPLSNIHVSAIAPAHLHLRLCTGHSAVKVRPILSPSRDDICGSCPALSPGCEHSRPGLRRADGERARRDRAHFRRFSSARFGMECGFLFVRPAWGLGPVWQAASRSPSTKSHGGSRPRTRLHHRRVQVRRADRRTLPATATAHSLVSRSRNCSAWIRALSSRSTASLPSIRYEKAQRHNPRAFPRSDRRRKGPKTSREGPWDPAVPRSRGRPSAHSFAECRLGGVPRCFSLLSNPLRGAGTPGAFTSR